MVEKTNLARSHLHRLSLLKLAPSPRETKMCNWLPCVKPSRNPLSRNRQRRGFGIERQLFRHSPDPQKVSPRCWQRRRRNLRTMLTERVLPRSCCAGLHMAPLCGRGNSRALCTFLVVRRACAVAFLPEAPPRRSRRNRVANRTTCNRNAGTGHIPLLRTRGNDV